MIDIQRCPKCARNLPPDAFPECHQGKPGNYCTECKREYRRAWNARHYKPKSVPCTVDGCGRRVHPQSKAPECTEHRPRPKPRPAGPTTYGSLHIRLREVRGKAADQSCAECQGPAHEWAYDHSDPDEVTGIRRGRKVRFSLDLNRYQPMCRSCHSKLDARESTARKPCSVTSCETRIFDLYDFCWAHRPGPLLVAATGRRGRRPGHGLDPEITAVVAARASQLTDVCRECKVEKSVEEFSRDRRAPNGYIDTCRPCMSAISLARYYRKKAGAVRHQ